MSNNTRNIPHYSDKGQYPDSYYAASRNPKPDRPTLENDIQVEICVVGGGFSGLSTALHLIEIRSRSCRTRRRTDWLGRIRS